MESLYVKTLGSAIEKRYLKRGPYVDSGQPRRSTLLQQQTMTKTGTIRKNPFFLSTHAISLCRLQLRLLIPDQFKFGLLALQ